MLTQLPDAADASDHEGAARAIAAGLMEGGHSRNRPGYWLHTGGTGILTWEDTKYDRLGLSSDKIYNDWDGIGELTSLPDEAFHRNVDKIVLEVGSKANDAVKTVIIAPPTIYGKSERIGKPKKKGGFLLMIKFAGNGRGPVSRRGRQVYELSKLVLTKQYTPIIGEGKARWNNVHIHDLSELYLLLTEAAVKGNVDKELWGDRGYLIVENGEHVWSDLARAVGRAAISLGYLQSAEEKALSKGQALETAGFEAVSWGLNSRARGERATKLLGWKPKKNGIFDEISAIVKAEHDRLQTSV